MKRIIDACRVAELKTQMEVFVEQKWHMRLEVVRQRQWTIAPTAKGRHFEPEQAEQIATLLSRRGFHHLFAVATENATDLDDEIQLWTCLELTVSSQELLMFSDEWTLINFLIIPADESFAILCTSEDYMLFVGPRDLIEEMIGQDIQTARAEFRKYFSDHFGDDMMSIVERYEAVGV